MTTTMKVTRVRRTHAMKLKELDDMTVRETARFTKMIASAECAMQTSLEDRNHRLADLAAKRARIVADAEAQAASLLEQVRMPLK